MGEQELLRHEIEEAKDICQGTDVVRVIRQLEELASDLLTRCEGVNDNTELMQRARQALR